MEEFFDKNNNTRIANLIDSLFKTFDTNFAHILAEIDNESIVIYLVIIVICLFFAKMLNVGLSLIFFLFVAFVLCYYIYSRRKLHKITFTEENKIKLELITPHPKHFDDYPDIIDFFYSIREFYYINPTAFYALVNATDNFIVLYENIMTTEMLYCAQNVQVAVDFVRNASRIIYIQ